MLVSCIIFFFFQAYNKILFYKFQQNVCIKNIKNIIFLKTYFNSLLRLKWEYFYIFIRWGLIISFLCLFLNYFLFFFLKEEGAIIFVLERIFQEFWIIEKKVSLFYILIGLGVFIIISNKRIRNFIDLKYVEMLKETSNTSKFGGDFYSGGNIDLWRNNSSRFGDNYVWVVALLFLIEISLSIFFLIVFYEFSLYLSSLFGLLLILIYRNRKINF